MADEIAPKPDDLQQLVLKHLETITELLGLRPMLITDLLFLEKSDWAFLIKISALLESATVVLLTEHFAKPELQEFFAQELEMSQRIKMARALNLISDGEVKMLQALSKMRNTLAHNAKETDFTFEKYFENKDRKRSFADNFATIWPDKVNDGDKQISRLQFVEKSPRFAVWAAMMKIAGHTVVARLQRQYEEQLQLALEGLRNAEPHVRAVSAEEIERDLNRKA
jgi:hypothetical protein